MAQIKISGMDGGVSCSNAVAQKISQMKKEVHQDKQKETWITVGSWEGYLSKVSSIVLENESKYQSSEDYSRKLTPEELKGRSDVMARVRKNLEDRGVLPRTLTGIGTKE